MNVASQDDWRSILENVASAARRALAFRISYLERQMMLPSDLDEVREARLALDVLASIDPAEGETL